MLGTIDPGKVVVVVVGTCGRGKFGLGRWASDGGLIQLTSKESADSDS